MTFLVPLSLAAFVPFTAWALNRLGPARGVMVALLTGTMFLPNTAPNYIPVLHDKPMYVSAVVLSLSILLDLGRWTRFRLGLVDVPALACSVLPAATAYSNQLGSNEAAAAALQGALIWGATWMLGRVYAGSPRRLHGWAITVVKAGLVYVPLCLWEVRMSPQLHRQLYGYHQHQFAQAYRAGGFRPLVFMTHGLMVALFMASATLIAYWLARSGARPRLGRIPMTVITMVLAGTTLLCKSAGPLILLAVGVVVLEVARRLRRPLPLILLLALPPAYCVARMWGWSAAPLIDASERYVSPDRAQSLLFRIRNETSLIQKAKQRVWLGWGRFGRSRVLDEEGTDITTIDGLWVGLLGVGGVVMLVAVGLLLALPGARFLFAFPARLWGHPRLGAAAVLVVVVALWAIDDLFNAMMNPVFPFTAGALTTFAGARRAVFAPPRRSPAARNGPTSPPAAGLESARAP